MWTVQRTLAPRKRRATETMLNQSHWPLFVKEEIRRYGKVGYTIRSLRLYNRYSQTELATLLGIRQNSVSRLEMGKALPTQDLCQRIADVFDSSPAMFV